MRLKHLALIAALAAMPVAAEACSCVVYSTVEKKIAAMDIASLGTPIEMAELDDPAVDEVGEPTLDFSTQFSVTRMYKGPNVATVELSHSRVPAMCGITFDAGEQLVFAQRSEDGRLRSSSCATIPFTYGGEDRVPEMIAALERWFPDHWWWKT